VTDPRDAPRPRKWWAALVLNVLFPPAGYAYAGAWIAVGASLLLIVAVPMLAMVATLEAPPGIYAAGGGPAALVSLAALGVLGLHAAYLARTAPPRTGAQQIGRAHV
jgi:hypothetical protein